MRLRWQVVDVDALPARHDVDPLGLVTPSRKAPRFWVYGRPSRCRVNVAQSLRLNVCRTPVRTRMRVGVC